MATVHSFGSVNAKYGIYSVDILDINCEFWILTVIYCFSPVKNKNAFVCLQKEMMYIYLNIEQESKS